MSGRTIQARELGQELAMGVGTVMSGVPVRWGAQRVREQPLQLPDLTPACGTPRPERRFSPCLLFLLGLEPGPDVSRPQGPSPKSRTSQRRPGNARKLVHMGSGVEATV